VLDEVRQVLQPLVMLRIVDDRAIFTELKPPPFDLVGAGDVSTTLLLDAPHVRRRAYSRASSNVANPPTVCFDSFSGALNISTTRTESVIAALAPVFQG
jgi:hypothetical protein